MCRKKSLVLLLFLTFILISGPVWAASMPPQVTADAAVLMDVRTGQVLFQKNAYQERPPASTTKILTTLLALEGGDLSQSVTISRKAASVGESSIYLQAGEKLTLEELIYGALIKSGNDACVAIAEHIAGTEENFVRLMNLKAKQLGALDSNFVNTNGLPAKDHYSSAYDLGVLARHALHNPVFNSIVSTKEKIISGPGWNRYLQNTNLLLDTYAGADGVKTGTTNAAGQCLVASATRNNRRLVCVVLHSDDRYRDSTALLEYGFKNFKYGDFLSAGENLGSIPVKDGVSQRVEVVVKNDLGAVISKKDMKNVEKKVFMEKELTAPVKKEQKVGKVELLINGIYVASTDLITSQKINRLPEYKIMWKNFWNKG